MKTLAACIILLLLTAGTQTFAESYKVNATDPAHHSFIERVIHAFLPGIQSEKRQTYGYSFAPSEEANHFRAPFKDGHTRLYVTDSESPFKLDPYMPSGNLFDFRF